MNIKDYIQSQLSNSSKYALSSDEIELIEEIGIEEFIYKKLTSKKFRKWKLDELSEKQVRGAISIAVSKKERIKFRHPFGGYKLWRMPSAPEVDWAEFFAIAYYCQYLAPIAAAYKPGLELVFSSDDLIIERMDNIPKTDTDKYFESFKKLLRQFDSYLPENMSVNIVRIADLYADKLAMEEELEENVRKMKVTYQNDVSEEKRLKMYITSELNIKWDGAKNFSQLTEEEKNQIVEMGPVYHDAYCALSKRREFNRGEDKIVIFTTPIPNAIALGTTKGSVTKFWTGFGVLEKTDDSYRAKVLSPKQLAAYGSKFQTESDVCDFGLRNFEDIRIYDHLDIS
jgi:hypothetical protein